MDMLQSILVTNNSNGAADTSFLGPRRSIVRRIGTQLPLGSADRPTFELLPNGSHVVRSSRTKMSMFSLADIVQLDDAPDSTSLRASASAPNLTDTISEIPVTSSVSTMSSVTSSASQDRMVTKISALEDELALLRSQIAQLVTSQQQHTSNVSTFDVSISSTLEPPHCTSTPIKPAEGAHHPPGGIPLPPPLPPGIPPPPPPPPPPPVTPAQERMSVQDLIRQRKLSKSQSTTDLNKQVKLPSSVPNMADVLKDLHKVKLKSVSRSPGGTPFNKKKNDLDPMPCDPASLIAAALKKKFAHRKNFESPKGEDNSSSSFDLNHITPKKRNIESPDETPKFGQHLLRKRNAVPPPALKPKPEVPSFLKRKSNLENVEPAS